MDVPRLTRLGLREEQRPYEPHGTANDIFYARDPEVLVDGPAGTGKSRAIIEKHHYQAMKYPKMRIVWVRKTRKSLTESTLVTYEDEVLPEYSPIKKGAGREHRMSYHYPNGSTIVPLGLDDDNVDKVMSSQWDAAFIEEAVEVPEEIPQKLGMRLRNRRGPYHQLIIATNPGGPEHYLLKQCEAGDCRRIQSTHKDNPVLWDGSNWTPAGVEYLDRLRKLKGHLYDRYFKGLWVASEGARWPTLSADVHAFNFAQQFPQGIPMGAIILLGIDYGLRAPFCALWFNVTRGLDHQLDLWCYREIYKPGLIATKQAQLVVATTALNEKIAATYIDPSMWQKPRDPVTGELKPSAADMYAEEFDKDSRFGALLKGYNASRQIGQMTLDNLLDYSNQGPNLHIEKERCPNLWSELSGAYWDTRGIGTKEDISPDCPDHAITACIYGTHNYIHVPREDSRELPTPQQARESRLKEMLEDEERRLKKLRL